MLPAPEARQQFGAGYLGQVSSTLADSILRTVGASLSAHDRVVLAVSGGLDSMALLDAAAATRERSRLVVASYDHGTGSSAEAACALVRRSAEDRRVECVVGHAPPDSIRRSEAAWRQARWTFLREVARARGALVATAHTADDQIETVLMRELRGAGPRGIAGLLAPTEVLRPLVGVCRTALFEFVTARGVQWVEDPTNASRRFLRNRLRHDVLPALRRVNPRIDEELQGLAGRAAEWRRETDAVAKLVSRVDRLAEGGAVEVGVAAIRDLDPEQLAVVWPAVAARIGVALDHRGIQRVSVFSSDARVGRRIQLSGGWEVVRSRHALRLQRSARDARPAAEAVLDLSMQTTWGGWTFWAGPRPSSVSSAPAEQSQWGARLPVDRPLRVREWRPGDRLISGSGAAGRKVKRLLNDAGVTGHERSGWPVVLSGDRIVWIPGVRRSDAATARLEADRPILAFSCARNGG